MSKKNSPKISPSNRKGTVVSSANSNANKIAYELGTNIDEIREYENGALGAFFTNGKFRFVKGANESQLSKARSSAKYSKNISPRSAKIAFNKYYKKKASSYKKESSIKKAIERDICHKKSPSKITSSALYRRSPSKYDYPGLDDGSLCTKKIVSSPKVASSNIDKALAAIGRKRHSATGGSILKKGKQGKPVSLKTAVHLLRQYYAEKYEH